MEPSSRLASCNTLTGSCFRKEFLCSTTSMCQTSGREDSKQCKSGETRTARSECCPRIESEDSSSSRKYKMHHILQDFGVDQYTCNSPGAIFHLYSQSLTPKTNSTSALPKEMAAPSTPMMKVTLLFCRDPSRDEETWHKWWNEELVPRIMPFALKHGIVRLETVCSPLSPEITTTVS